MKARYFIIISLLLLGVTILSLRYNNVTAYNMQARIIEQDAVGEDVSGEVEELKEFVFTHMNASMEFTLTGAYRRAVNEAMARADEVDGSIYEEAQRACDREGQLTTENAECVINYVAQHLDNGQNNTDNMPQQAQFHYVLRSPIWTTDLPGVSLLLTFLSLIAAIGVYGRNWLKP